MTWRSHLVFCAPLYIFAAFTFGIGALSLAAQGAPDARPDVLIVQRAYDGPVELAGALVEYRYTNGHMLVGWVDTTADGVFRNAFEVVP